MIKNQIYNLTNFSILFHKAIRDSQLMSCNITYIEEKYNKMIGINIPDDGSLIYTPDRIVDIVHKWHRIWNRDGSLKLSFKQQKIFNYLCMINSYGSLKITDIISLFEEYIGRVDDINVELYGHLHPNFMSFIEDILMNNRREINLLLLDN